MRVWLVLDDENNVGGNGVGRLVSLPREGDLGPFFPAPLDLNREDLVLSAHGPAVRIEPFAGDFHPLGAAVEDLLQGDPQFVDDGRVLLPALLAPEPHMSIPGEAVQVKAGEGAEGVVSVHLHVLIVSAVGFTSKEDIEGV